jgi:hypothetical protein
LETIATDLLPISCDGELSIIAVLNLHVEGWTSVEAVSGAATPVIAGAITSAGHGVQGCGTTATPICFNPVNLQTVRVLVLAIITVGILCKASTNTTRRHGVYVGDHARVRLTHIEIELHVTTKQIECCLRGGSAVSLDGPSAVLDLHRVPIRHSKVAGARAVQIC